MAGVYQNPVYPHSSPDPFVFKHRGEYWCTYTGIQEDGRCFGILYSPDLVHWRRVGSAMDPLPGGHTCYWAPEVVYRDGVFYMYYSVGNEENMQIRVATARHPAGPYVDSGHRLTHEKFAIDAHVFIDDGDRWYLFYATDFLDVERVGTGTVMDAMRDPFTLAGSPRPVTRAKFDWQIYDPQRTEKGGARWHTIEGSFVLKHAGLYYQMFSGGNWQNTSYGVAYGVTNDLDSPSEWHQPCDGVSELPILRSLPQEGVIGPGHNSVVRGPDNRELFCVYHRWQPETKERVLAIDRMGWEGEKLRVYGPSHEPQALPRQPQVSGFEPFSVRGGTLEEQGEDGEWRLAPGTGFGRAILPLPETAFAGGKGAALVEADLRFPPAGVSAPVSDGARNPVAGIALVRGTELILRLEIYTVSRQVRVEGGGSSFAAELPPGFALDAFHLLRVELTLQAALVSVDGRRLAWSLPPITRADELHLFAAGRPAGWDGFALTLTGQE